MYQILWLVFFKLILGSSVKWCSRGLKVPKSKSKSIPLRTFGVLPSYTRPINAGWKLFVNSSWICIRNTTLYVEYMYCYLNILYRTSYLTFINQDSQLQLFDIQFESAHLYIPLVLLSCEFYTQCTSGYNKLSVRYSFSCSTSFIKTSNLDNCIEFMYVYLCKYFKFKKVFYNRMFQKL